MHATTHRLRVETAAGLKKPDISILSDEFLAEIRGLPQRNLAVEMLRKLLRGDIRTRSRKNIVQARSFAEMLENSILRYQNRAIETAQVIEELIALAKEMREAEQRGEKLGLTEQEVACYDSLEVNDSAVAVLGDENLRLIAQELVRAVRGSVTTDWTVRENVRAHIRVIIKRILRRYGYPPRQASPRHRACPRTSRSPLQGLDLQRPVKSRCTSPPPPSPPPAHPAFDAPQPPPAGSACPPSAPIAVHLRFRPSAPAAPLCGLNGDFRRRPPLALHSRLSALNFHPATPKP